MQTILAYAAWGALFSLLSGLPAKPDAFRPNVKLADQAKLQGYLERCEKELGASWLIKSEYNIARVSAFHSNENGVGQVILLRLPGMPEVFWQFEKWAAQGSFFKLHIGQCRLFCNHRASKAIDIALDFRGARIARFDWQREDKFWADNAPHLWIRGFVGSYDYHFHNGEFSIYKHFSLGLEELFEKLDATIHSQGPVGLLLCMKKQSQERCELKLTKDDKNYIYIEAFPKDNHDKSFFAKAQVVIDKSTFLPRRLWYAESNRDTNTYNFIQMLTRP